MKNEDRWLRILNLVTSLSVLVGVILVIIQLRQTEELSLEDRRQTHLTTLEQVEASIIGEDMAETLARIESDPESVTDADLIKFRVYADVVMTTWALEPDHLDGLTKSNALDWSASHLGAQDTVCSYFGTKTGRDYLAYGELNFQEDDWTPWWRRVRELADGCDQRKSYLKFMHSRRASE